MQTTAWMLAGAMALPFTAAIAADGEANAPGQPGWARWQGRLSLGSAAAPWHAAADNAAPKFSSASLMGDYYFGRSLAGPTLLGGFRATTGLMVGQRAMFGAGQPSLASGSTLSVGSRSLAQPLLPYSSDSVGETGTATYLGVGYTGLALRSGWSFSADMGLLAQGNAASRWGRSLANSQQLDDAIRQMRMTPLLQLGAAYSF